MMHAVKHVGFFAPLVFIPVFVILTVFFMPTVLLTLMAGALFGIPMGVAVVLIASLIGASGGFLAGRNLSRGWVSRKIVASPKVRALDNAVNKAGWKMVLLLRLSGILPFTILNYILGLSKISFKRYFLVSGIGMIPGALLYVYLGTLAGKIVFEKTSAQKTSLEWVLVGFGFAVTLTIGIYSALVVKKALQASTIE